MSSFDKIRRTRGATFPSGPGTGDRHVRSDLGDWECVYDGARWLTAFEFPVGGWLYYPGSTVGAELTAGQEYLYTANRQDYTLRATRWELYGYVNGTNNGTNYWTVDLRTFIGGSTMATHSTSGWSGSTWTRNTAITSFSPQPATSDYGLELVANKTLSPGAFRFAFTLYAQLVVT